MKIKKIEHAEWDYQVTFEPNWLEKLFGVKPKTKKYRAVTGARYTFGGGRVYHDQNGKELGNGNWIGEAIDEWMRKF